VISKQMDELQM